MPDFANQPTVDGMSQVPPRAEAKACGGCPIVTYLAVVAGFAASFVLLGALI
jgi:hypothetical protein